MFDGFASASIEVDETEIFVRHAGRGPALLLLHGFPETHVMWRAVAPALTADFTVVCADLRGYGVSGKPPSASDHAPYAKRAMARDMVQMMTRLGFDRFSVAGHDRGGRVAYRLALDHPERVQRLALFDIIPTMDAFDRADARFRARVLAVVAAGATRPAARNARRGRAGSDRRSRVVTMGLGSGPRGFPGGGASGVRRCAPLARRRCTRSAKSIAPPPRWTARTTKRIAALDRTIACPVLALWSEGSSLDTWYVDAGGPLGILRQWAAGVSGRAVRGGHFFPEQNPDETAAALRDFMR